VGRLPERNLPVSYAPNDGRSNTVSPNLKHAIAAMAPAI
jgi:hypothetical protein